MTCRSSSPLSRSALFPFVVAVLVGLAGLLACAPPAQPGPEDGAAYLGIAAGQTFRYDAGGNVSETHELKASSVLVEGKLVFDLVARQNGFVVDERSLTLAVGPEDVQIVRFADCITVCGQPAEPIPFLALPLDDGQQSEIEVEVARTRNGTDEGSVTEKHVFITSGVADVTVPAGTFQAHTVSWTRTREGQSDSAVLRIAPAAVSPTELRRAAERDEPPAPGQGIISWDAFDGAQLELAQ